MIPVWVYMAGYERTGIQARTGSMRKPDTSLEEVDGDDLEVMDRSKQMTADDPASHRCHGNQGLSKRPIVMESIIASV